MRTAMEPGKFKAAAAATLACLVPLSLIGATLLVVTGSLVLRPANTDRRLALFLAGCLVIVNAWSSTLSWFIVFKQRLVLAAKIMVLGGTVTTLTLCALLVVGGLKTAGAVLASVVGCTAMLLVTTFVAVRGGMLPRPAWDGEYLRGAARVGVSVQLSNLFVQMSGRLDLIFVYLIVGSAGAGRYSIALTVGALVGFVPTAISFTAFPSLPGMTDDEARLLTARIFRASVTAGTLCSVGLAVVAPLALPLVFGAEYRGAIVPTLLLIPGGVFWSGQWVLCRAAAARGVTRPLLVSFAASFVGMVLLDLVLVRPFGLTGAAIASSTSSLIGFLFAARHCRRLGWIGPALVPRASDVMLIVDTLKSIVGGIRGSRGDTERDSSPISS